MNLYLAKIIYCGDAEYKLVKADDKNSAKEKVLELYYGSPFIEILYIIE